jgi:spermidine/putrescine transport system permease protein
MGQLGDASAGLNGSSAVWKLLPGTSFYIVFFAIPLAALLVLSFWQAQGFKLIPDLSIGNYEKIATSQLYRTILWRSLLVGFTTSLIVVPLAFAMAYVMRFILESRGQMILQLILLSLFSGYLVRIYAWRTILGKQGLINTTLQWLGLTDAPIEFLIYSNFAVVVTLTGLLLPLAVLPIYSAMLNVSRDYLDAARDMGAGPAYRLRTILVPMVLPGIRTALAFTFLLSAGDFVTPALVGGSQSILIGSVVADQFRGIGSNWPLGAALVFVMTASVLVVFVLMMRLIKVATRW